MTATKPLAPETSTFPAVMAGIVFKVDRALVGRFKIFSTIYGEKCHLFFKHFSVKK
jgi:hypothetical protein